MAGEAGNVIDEVYLHISNGGVTFAVRDSGHGPEVVVESSTFGNNAISQRVLVAPRVLTRLAKLFVAAANHAAAGKFSATYCCEADYRDEASGDPRDNAGGSPGGPPPGAMPGTPPPCATRRAKWIGGSAGAAPGSPN